MDRCFILYGVWTALFGLPLTSITFSTGKVNSSIIALITGIAPLWTLLCAKFIWKRVELRMIDWLACFMIILGMGLISISDVGGFALKNEGSTNVWIYYIQLIIASVLMGNADFLLERVSKKVSIYERYFYSNFGSLVGTGLFAVAVWHIQGPALFRLTVPSIFESWSLIYLWVFWRFL